MFRPPVDYVWRQKVKQYQDKFNAQVPQWLQTFDIVHSIKILSISIQNNWVLPNEVLTSGESFTGYQSLWCEKKNKWDIQLNKTGDEK